MCGIVFSISQDDNEDFVRRASQIQAHRGPDAEGLLFEKQGVMHLGFGHQRLAIVDLSDAGRQPMNSISGRYTIIFNGEIYNYRELVAKFGLKDLRGGSDTEVALRIIDQLGFEEALRHFNGMWAIVLWDRHTGRIHLSRDRFGKKPLLFTVHRGGIYVASEVKAFLALPGFEITPSRQVCARFLAQMIQNADTASWVESVENFPAACVGEIDPDNLISGVSNVRAFWEPTFDPEMPEKSDSAYIAELCELVTDATRLRLHADVPVGIALSGGLDSSILASIAAKARAKDSIETVLFSVVHPGEKDDESEFVNRMGSYLKSDVKKFTLDVADGKDSAEGILDLISRCNFHNDGPVSSLSTVLFYKMMEQARQMGITVVLTGQGADEGFCGYRKYPILELKHRISRRRLVSAGAFLGGFIRNGTMLGQFRLAEAKRYLGASNNGLLGKETRSAYSAEAISDVSGGISKRQWLDIDKYSVPYLCHYEDRMSMAWSREVRSPFLDYRVIELGLQMPTHLKMQRGWTKYALRKAFAEQLPKEITWRKDKKGFVNPEAKWFRTSLRPLVEEVMGDPGNLVYKYGLVDRVAYLTLYRRFCEGDSRIWFRDIFSPFSLSVWLHRFENEKMALQRLAA